MQANNDRNLTGVALAGGFALSFVGLGVLWAGVPWSYQFLMFFPFCLVAFAIARWGGKALWMLVGTLPIALLLVQFRDKDDSHLFPILVCLVWGLGILLGHFIGGRRPKSPNRALSEMSDQ